MAMWRNLQLLLYKQKFLDLKFLHSCGRPAVVGWGVRRSALALALC